MIAAIKERVTVQRGGVIEVRSPELVAGQQADVIILIEAPNPAPPNGPAQDTPLSRLRRFAGAVDSGDPHSSDNERIDADLAKAYGATNELAT